MILEAAPVDAQGRAGTSDLWVSVLRNGEWSAPASLGPEVNSPGFEAFAGFTPDNDYVLFVRQFETYHRVPVSQVVALAGRR